MPHSRDCETLLESPFLKLSQSFPSMSLSLALEQVKMDLNNSCFGSICANEKGAVVDDDELKPLSWLQNTDLLKDIYLDDDDDYDEEDEENSKENFDSRDPHGYNGYSYNDGPIDPKRHINSKPPFSFSCLIFMAIEDSQYKRLPVKDIYHWIEEHFPFYQTAPTGWKNSVRHNLSLNKCFRKVEKLRGQQALCKGSLWCVDPDYRPNLLQALRKTPFHPYHHVLPFAPYGLPGGPLANISYSNPANRLPTILSAYGNGIPIPAHILLVEKLLSGLTIHHQTITNVSNSPDAVAADAAATMMMFKVPPEQREEHLRRLFSPNGAAPAQAKPQQPHLKPTLADLAETALSDYRKPRHPATPHSKAALKAKCTPSPGGCDDHTYSLSTKLHSSSDFGSSDDDPVEFDASDLSEGSFIDSESESEDAVESRSFNDSGVFSKGKFKRELDKEPIKLPLKKRLKKSAKNGKPHEEERELAEGADALLNLAGIKTELNSPRSRTPTAELHCHDNLSPVSR